MEGSTEKINSSPDEGVPDVSPAESISQAIGNAPLQVGVATTAQAQQLDSSVSNQSEQISIATHPLVEGETSPALNIDAADSSGTHAATNSEIWFKEFVLDLLDKQYRLYSWTDAKALSLITTNSLLLAAIGFLFKECLQDVLATILISMALVLSALSLFYSLVQVIPQGSSGRGGATPNLRALSGILTFKSWQKYEQAFHDYSLQNAISDTLRQAYGMAHNTDQGRKSITIGVRLTIASLVFVVLSAFGVAGSAAGYNPLGKWQQIAGTERSEAANVKLQKSDQAGILRVTSSKDDGIDRPSTNLAPKEHRSHSNEAK
jgi:hypothetical protein